MTVLIFLSIRTYSDKIEKGFEKLKEYDYFSAKNYFEKSLEDETAASAYGLSSIYSFEKNPFYNPDSARKYILLAKSAYTKLKEKSKKKYSEFGVTDSTIQSLSEFICMDAFNKAVFKGTLESYNHYLKNFISCAPYSEAVILRNEAAFNEAVEINTSTAFKEFIALYPQSLQYSEAVRRFEELVFRENTSDRTIESYERFIVNFPESPYKFQAEKTIYTLSVPDKSLNQYVAYVRKYRNSRYTRDAWQNIYKRAMTDYTESTFNNFKKNFPDYPFPDELETDYRLQNYFFLPFEKKDKWGYINELGMQLIKPAYDEASFFSEGLASVSDSNKYGYINKSGKRIINFDFIDAEPFRNGGAIVKKDSLYGLIDKNGDFLITPVYEELSEVSEDIYMGVKNDHSGYISKEGIPLTDFIYDLAGEFISGFAIVNKNEKFGLIDKPGNTVINPQYAELVFIGNDRLKALSDDDAWGIINSNGDVILPFEYDAIGEFHENRALVAKENKCGYVDSQGAIVIPLRYQYTSILLTTGFFKEGYALVKQKYRSLIIDSTGKAISVAGAEDYGRPAEGFIPVKKNKKWGYADMSGKIKIPAKFESAEPFYTGLAIIGQNKMKGIADTTGFVYIIDNFEDIIIRENLLQIRMYGKTGLMTRGGVYLLPAKFDKIDYLDNNIVRASSENELLYLNLIDGKVINTIH